MKKIMISAATALAMLALVQLPANALENESSQKTFKDLETMAQLKVTYNTTTNIASDIDLRFGGEFDKAMFTEGAEYGVVASTDAAALTDFNLTKLEEAKKANRAMKLTPELIDDTKYQFAWVIDNVEDHLNDTLHAALYELNGETVTLAKVKSHSVSSIADEYLKPNMIAPEYTDMMNIVDADCDAQAGKLNWDNKQAIIDGGWKVEGDWWEGTGEGVDLKDVNKWSYITKEVKIPASMPHLRVGTRVFVRGGETYPEFQLKVNGEIIRAIGSDSDTVYTQQDNTKFIRYDLSKFIGKTVNIEYGATKGSHCVITQLNFKESATPILSYSNKEELLNAFTYKTIDAGVGEGLDITGGNGTYAELKEAFVLPDNNYYLTIGTRVFNRPNETYPNFKVSVNGKALRAIGADKDTVYVDTDAIQHFSYDLKEFIGQEVSIKIMVEGECTHAVITDIFIG